MPYSTFLVLLACCVPIFALVGVILCWRWRIDKRNERLPFADKLLRPAGESLRNELAKVDEKLNGTLILTLVSPFGIAVALLTIDLKSPMAGYLVFGLAGAGALLWAARDLLKNAAIREIRAAEVGHLAAALG